MPPALLAVAHGTRSAAGPETVRALLGRIRLLRPEEAPDIGSQVEDGLVQDVIYAGMVTRYAVQLDRGGRLLVVQQNTESAAHASDLRGRRVRLAWRPEQGFNISTPQSDRPELQGNA